MLLTHYLEFIEEGLHSTSEFPGGAVTVTSGRFRVYDVLYGFIELSRDEARLIDTSVFQRLRRIKQLSLANLVYPGAEHTRFAHSLGVYWLASRVVSRLVESGFVDEDEAALFRIAALLHDIGHLPYSHAIEFYYHLKFRERISDKFKFHEKLSHTMILLCDELREVIVSLGYDPKEVVALLTGTHRDIKLTSLISSDLDVDRLDYLPRDAHHTGVAYGLIDRERILDTLTVLDDGRIAIDEKGIQAVESFYVARLHMYQAVYYHKTISGYELYLAKIYEELVEYDPELNLLASPQGLEKVIKDSTISIIDDYWLYSKMLQALKDNYAPKQVKKRIQNLLSRKGPKTVYNVSLFTHDPKCIKDAKHVVDVLVDCGVEEDSILVLETTIKFLGSEDEIVYVKTRAEDIIPITEASQLISNLPRYYYVERVYVEREYVDKALKCIKKK
ncbi:MAG TPA: HD domain-containing protein [Pyrodictium sp.]|nr:HD domain-containing protein [Pyrodictium sp.]